VTTDEARALLVSKVCPSCQEPKDPMKVLCRRCFVAVPFRIQRKLYSRVGAGFEAAADVALKFLEARRRNMPRTNAAND